MRDDAITALGQVGYKFTLANTVIYIDPYLSNSVQEKEDPDIARLVPVPIDPRGVTDADFVLITHAHRDHCDEDTLLPISEASSQARFVGPQPVCAKLKKLGIVQERIVCANSDLVSLNDDIKVHVVPAAHPEIKTNEDGVGWQSVGYIIESAGVRVYHAGDTSLRQEIVDSIKRIGDVDIAMIPVNEQNYMREKKGIIGNMTVREAFYLGEQIGVKTFIPTHWDMFAQNQVYKEEIELLYNLLKPAFKLLFKEVSQ